MATPLLFFLFVITVILIIHQSSSKATNNGFKLDLIHSDSPLSPLYNPNATSADRWAAAYHRSLARRDYFSSMISGKAVSVQGFGTPIAATSLGYTIKLSIGTPPVDVVLTLDTGSDLIWTQCLPCVSCYRQNYPIFDPRKSSSYRRLACNDPACISLPGRPQCSNADCKYSSAYGDGSKTSGYLSTENFNLTGTDGGYTAPFELVFGCGDTNAGVFNGEETGILGIARGPLSFAKQLGLNMTGFSYCLVPGGQGELIISAERFHFGDWTPMVWQPGNILGLYYVNLIDISVAGERLNIPAGTFDKTIIDSGTPYTLLNSAGYELVVAKLKQVIKMKQVGKRAALCYYGSKKDMDGGKIPDITFHFKGLDVPAGASNYFIEAGNGMICLAMASMTDGFSVFGSIAQENKYVMYDLNSQEIYIDDFCAHEDRA